MVNTLHILLANLIDYAGLFPPAELKMPEALANYAAYSAGEHAWALGRFIVPAARLNEVDPSFPVSVLGLPPHHVEVCELKGVPAKLPDAAITYCEIPLDFDPAPLEALGARAKIRMGGDSFPSCAAVAKFLRARIPFKATAGLHHPIRSGPMHGFVNLFLAADLAWRCEDPLPTLEEQSATAFHFGDDAVAWHDHTLPAAELREVRKRFAISFGSCSFEEPIADLKALGWL